MILIPVKNLDTAKQRLASVLDQPARTALAQVMLQDVLARLAEWTQRPAVAVVTSDPFEDLILFYFRRKGILG